MNIGFLVPWPLNPDLTAYWSMWATVATAAATVALVIFAVFAWRAALSTISTQTNSDQIAALADYVKALNALSRSKRFELPLMLTGEYSFPVHQEQLSAHRAELIELSHLLESSATIWRAHHKTVGGDMAAFAEAEYFLLESIDWWNKPTQKTDSNKVDEQHKLWSEFAKDLSRRATHWQVNDADRQKTSNNVGYDLDRYLQESPLVSDAYSEYLVFPDGPPPVRRRRWFSRK